MEASDRGSPRPGRGDETEATSGPGRLIDSHCHLEDPAFDPDRPAVLERAAAAGVIGVVVIGAGSESADRARRLVAAGADGRGPELWYTAGLHPHDAGDWSEEVGRSIAGHLAAGAVAIGETGLDYHYDNSPRDAQRDAFAAQLELARGADAPVVVHTRDAEDDTLALLAAAEIAADRVVLHCFTGSAAMLDTAVERGYYVSFSGIATFPKFPAADLAPRVPADRLLVETDAPYLAPVPHRGRRNEPAYLAATVAALAGLRGEEPGRLGAATAANARRFYGLEPAAGAG